MRHPEVVISWAHFHRSWSADRTARWCDTVRAFAETLVRSGVRTEFDLWHSTEAGIDWTRWGQRVVEQSEFTLIVISRAWRERWQGFNTPQEGAGVAVEADTIKGIFHRDQELFQRKHIIVLLDGTEVLEIPPDLHRLRRVRIDDISVEGIAELVMMLTGQPRYAPPALGQVPVYPVQPSVGAIRAGSRLETALRSSGVRARATVQPETIPRVDRLAELTQTLGAGIGSVAMPLVIVGDGGYGKSVLLGQLFDALAAEAGHTVLVPCGRVPVSVELTDLAALDRALGDAALDSREGLPLSGMVAELASGGPVRVLIDTLDLVVREDNADDLLYLLRDLAQRCDLVITCREQEWRDYLENDPRSAASLYPMPALTAEDVQVWAAAYLATVELDSRVKESFLDSLTRDRANRGVLDICASPLRLAMACEVYAKSGSIPPDLTITRLYEQYWDKQVARDRRGRRSAAAGAQVVEAEAIAARVWEASRSRFVEFVPDEHAPGDPAALRRLLSDGVVKSVGGRTAFFHQTYGEFAVARLLARTGTESDLARLAEGLRSATPAYWSIAKHLLMVTTDAARYLALSDCVPADVVEGVRAQFLGAFNRGSADLVAAVADRLWAASPELVVSCSGVLESAPDSCVAPAFAVVVRCATACDITTASRVGITAAKLIIRLRPDVRAEALRKAVRAFLSRAGNFGNEVTSSVLSRLVQQVARAAPALDLVRVLVDQYEDLPEAARAEVLARTRALPPVPDLDEALLVKALRWPCPEGAVGDASEILIRAWEHPRTRTAIGWGDWPSLFELDLPVRWDACQVRWAAALCADRDVARELFDRALGPDNTVRDRYTNAAKFLVDHDRELVVGVIRNLRGPLPQGAVGTLCAMVAQMSGRLFGADRQAVVEVLERYADIDVRRVWPTIVALCADDVHLLRARVTRLSRWAAELRADDTKGRTVVRSTLTAFLNTVAPVVLVRIVDRLRPLCEGSDPADRGRRARLEGMVAAYSDDAREWIEREAMHGESRPVATGAANSVVAGFADWSDESLLAEGVPWLLRLLGSAHGSAVLVLAEGLAVLGDRITLPTSGAEAVAERLSLSIAAAEDAQVQGALLDVLVKMEHTAGGVTEEALLTVLRVLGAVVRAPSRERRQNQLPAHFALYIRSITAIGIRHLDQDAAWTLTSHILTTIDTGLIAGKARRPLTSLLLAVVKRYPVLLARLEELWPKTPETNKRAIAECFVNVEAGTMSPRSLGLARRHDCPADVANYILAKVGG